MGILDAIVEKTRLRVEERRSRTPERELRARLKDAPPTRSFSEALTRGFGVIAEHKRRSPSGGPSNPKNVHECLGAYAETPWIRAVSVLTDEDYFDGRLDDLRVARETVGKPVLRKDFIVDEYQVVEARVTGADAILLMGSVLFRAPARMQALYDAAKDVGLDVLVELGMSERPIEELVALVPSETRIWGINARQFATRGEDTGGDRDAQATHDLPTDVSVHRDYRKLVPPGKIAVAESGIHTAAELGAARAAGYHAALVGTAFLKGPASVREVVAELGRAFA
ncbi:MAG TPA: indole-3-glycerol phosphate synthase TrpC [Polyangiaceae bacterium]|nr:indole-3-glycerol phosphate synthase TrpC [Polyangiaceae bacterium]